MIFLKIYLLSYNWLKLSCGGATLDQNLVILTLDEHCIQGVSQEMFGVLSYEFFSMIWAIIFINRKYVFVNCVLQLSRICGLKTICSRGVDVYIK